MPDQNGRIAVVTGAAGFIASHITHALVSLGYRVRAVDDLTGGMGWSRLEDLGDRIGRHQMSILTTDGLTAVLRGAQVVVHHAALISVPESVERPIDYQRVNATGTLQLLEACRTAGVRRVVYASTSAVYGDGPEQPKRESMVTDPISPYAVSKYAGERYVSAYARLHGMETICLRYFNVFGPGQNLKSQYGAAVPAIVTRILRGEPPTVYGDGEQTRDFCHVHNVVRANLLAVAAPKLGGEVVNIGCGRRASVNQIIAAANRLLGRSVSAKFDPPRAGDVRDSLADVALAKRVLGYEPVLQFEEGLEQTLPWYREQVGRG
jgi:nucleoside-diphosphate-sugar epimerase